MNRTALLGANDRFLSANLDRVILLVVAITASQNTPLEGRRYGRFAEIGNGIMKHG